MSIRHLDQRKDENQAVIVAALRDAGARVWPIGWPLDLLVAANGKFMLMEVKNRGGKLTASQQKLFEDMLGYPLFIVTEIDEALRLIGQKPRKHLDWDAVYTKAVKDIAA